VYILAAKPSHDKAFHPSSTLSLSFLFFFEKQVSRVTLTRLYEEPPRKIERGVSVDQDGKSNVWAIEPKVEIQQKSNEEQSTAALLAVGGLAVCGAAAAFILTNLPDPNQF
jgi:hypothetical protein